MYSTCTVAPGSPWPSGVPGFQERIFLGEAEGERADEPERTAESSSCRSYGKDPWLGAVQDDCDSVTLGPWPEKEGKKGREELRT
jgi:hypothetical protein